MRNNDPAYFAGWKARPSWPSTSSKSANLFIFSLRCPATLGLVTTKIVRRLPESEGEFHYVIRSTYEDHERVARESELSRV
jgi:hypothetical protein